MTREEKRRERIQAINRNVLQRKREKEGKRGHMMEKRGGRRTRRCDTMCMHVRTLCMIRLQQPVRDKQLMEKGEKNISEKKRKREEILK